MLDFDHQEAWELGRYPFLVIRISLLLLDAIIAGQMEALRIIRLQVWIGRRSAEGGYVVREMAMEHHERIVRLRMGIEPVWQ